MEAVGFLQTRGPGANSTDAENPGLVSNDNSNRPAPQPSTWTGLVDLEKEGINSIVGMESSEISEEHVVIHLRRDEASARWAEPRNPAYAGVQEVSGPKITTMMSLSSLESLETQGGSAKEEEADEDEDADGYTGSSSTLLSALSSPTQQAQASNGIFSNLVNSIMRPWRYLTGSEAEGPATPTNPPDKSLVEMQGPAGSGKGLSGGGKTEGSNRSTNNDIMENFDAKASQRSSDGGPADPNQDVFQETRDGGPTNPDMLNPNQPTNPPTSLQTDSSGGKSNSRVIESHRACILNTSATGIVWSIHSKFVLLPGFLSRC